MGRSVHPFLVTFPGIGFSLALAFFCAPRGWAYPVPVDFDGSLLRWPIEDMETGILYEIEAEMDQDLDQYRALIEEAAGLWFHAGGSQVSYELANDAQAAHVTVKLVRTLKDGAFASGYTTFDEWEGKRPLHCSIFIHISEDYSFDGIAKTILHEMGHGLGLGHTLVPEAIMSYSLEKNRFAIDVDDAAAIARLYPGDGTKPRLPIGCAIQSAQGHGSGLRNRSALVVTMLLGLTPLLVGMMGAGKSPIKPYPHPKDYGPGKSPSQSPTCGRSTF